MKFSLSPNWLGVIPRTSAQICRTVWIDAILSERRVYSAGYVRYVDESAKVGLKHGTPFSSAAGIGDLCEKVGGMAGC